MEKRKYEQLVLRERIEIYRLHADGKSLRCIAGVLGRSAATISRELTRNVRLPNEMLASLDRLANDERRTRGNAIRLLLEEALEQRAARK
jgi:IS30 family transposase